MPTYPLNARSHLSTRASPVSISKSRLPALLLYLPLVSTAWLSLPVASYSLLPTKFLPGLPEAVYMPPPGATMPLFCDRPPRSPSCLRILQILVTMLLSWGCMWWKLSFSRQFPDTYVRNCTSPNLYFHWGKRQLAFVQGALEPQMK